ncbi:MAG: CarD family transcriptional regulator [Rhodoblastus sp.]
MTKTSKVKTVASTTKSKTASAKTVSAKTVGAKTVNAKAKTAQTKAGKAKSVTTKSVATKSAVVKNAAAKSAARNSTGKTAARSAARTPAKAVGKAAPRKTAAVAKSAKSSAELRAAKSGVAPATAGIKSEKNRVAAVVKETMQEKAKQPQITKAGDTSKITTATNLKPVGQADARARVQLVRPEAAEPVAPATPAPASVRAAPDPRPALTTPAMQPRETSEQNPVTQKKTLSPAPTFAKPFKPAVKPAIAEQRPAKPAGQKPGFKPNEHIVYPAHGVGQIIAIEEQEVAGFKLELFVISFVKDKMILKVPTPKVVSVGMRKLAEAPIIAKALDTLTGRARIKRTMWSRRAQEYEAKINSGDLIAIAEVVRDLYRSEAQPEQSYSERQLYEAALDRMSRELAVVQKITEQESLKLIDSQLQKGPRRAAKTDTDAEAGGDVEEAA